MKILNILGIILFFLGLALVLHTQTNLETTIVLYSIIRN